MLSLSYWLGIRQRITHTRPGHSRPMVQGTRTDQRTPTEGQHERQPEGGTAAAVAQFLMRGGDGGADDATAATGGTSLSTSQYSG